MLETRPDHKKLSLEIHQDNRNAGWWTDLAWQDMDSAPTDGTEFLAYSVEQNADNPLPPFISICSWHPDAGFCTDEIREPIKWHPMINDPFTKANRNFGELLSLVHSELSECYEGILKKCKDTHLTNLPMEQVEIADACIRVYDMIGGLLFDEPFYTDQSLDFPIGWMSKHERLVYMHYTLSNALEHYRKSRLFDCKKQLLRFLDYCFEYAEDYNFDLLAIIERKREYNRQRADHKIVNRIKEDGKKI